MRPFLFAQILCLHNDQPHQPSGLRPIAASLVVVGLLLFGIGCANMTEKRTISAFQEGIEKVNIETLKGESTARFEQLALRHPECSDSLEQLNLPDGEFEILEIEEVSEQERKVTVGFGKENRRKIQYQLVKDVETKKWKVDDIFLRQRSAGKTIAMPVTEQMDVLLSSREFYEAWQGTDRERALSYCTAELSSELSKLPPHVLAALVKRAVGGAEPIRTYRPEVHISGDRSVIELNRPKGKLVISMVTHDQRWLIKDLAFEARDAADAITSLQKQARISNQTFAFLEAWNKNNKPALEEITSPEFYQAGLAPGTIDRLGIAGNARC